MSSQFPPPYGHDPIEEVFPDIWVVRGTIKMGVMGWISRNMTIVREGEELTVISAVRLNAESEAELDKLGRVKNVVKLGQFHAHDDPYYLDRYQASYWALPKHVHSSGLEADQELGESNLPLETATFFEFKNALKAEACIILNREGGILLSCDAVQHFVDLTRCSPQMRVLLRGMGFVKPANIGPGWLREAQSKDGPSLKEDFERLLSLEFKHLLSAHGIPLRDTAKEGLTATVKRIYG